MRAPRNLVPNPVFAASTAVLWAIHQLLAYPLSYLVVPDREIWFVQLGTWIWILGQAAVLGVAAGWLLEAIRRALARARIPSRAGEIAFAAEAALNSPAAPLLLGAISFIAAAWAQGPLQAVTTGPDEAAYLMQAKLLASGHWRAPAAPLPAFFEQMYVFVSPFTAAKYPPGFPLALVPGIWLHAAFLLPALFIAVTAGLMFALGRRLAGPWVSLLTVVLWTMNPHGEAPLQRLMSEHLSTMLVVGSWWALDRWRRSERLPDLLLLAFGVGWGAITRPLTMFAIAIPIAVVVLRRISRTRRWGQLAAASATGLAILLILPLWARETTGDWRVAPLALHVRWYTPYDALGFGTPPRPLRTLPPDLDQVRTTLYRSRLQHRYIDIPRLIVERTVAIAHDAFPGWRAVFLPFLIAALFLSRPEVSFAAISVLADFTAYLALSHPPHLTKYYLENYPALFFIAAVGLWAALFGRGAPERSETKAGAAAAVVGLVLVVVSVSAGVGGIRRYREDRIAEAAPKLRFLRRLEEIPANKAVVFVRYGPAHVPHMSLIENDGDLARERVWIVYDRGAENARLRAVAPDRTPYLYDEASDQFIRLDRPLDRSQSGIVGPSADPITAPSSESLPRMVPDAADASAATP